MRPKLTCTCYTYLKTEIDDTSEVKSMATFGLM